MGLKKALIVLVVVLMSATTAMAKHKRVLVALYENLSNVKKVVSYEANTTSASLDNRRKTYSVDRYSEIPRTILEDKIFELGGDVVERQSLNKLLMEHKFISESGLADTSTALKIAKMVGANTLVVGTIVNISKENKHFRGYGISTHSVIATVKVRTRVIDVETARVIYSKRGKGQARSLSRTPPYSEAIENAVEEVASDDKFAQLFKD